MITKNKWLINKYVIALLNIKHQKVMEILKVDSRVERNVKQKNKFISSLKKKKKFKIMMIIKIEFLYYYYYYYYYYLFIYLFIYFSLNILYMTSNIIIIYLFFLEYFIYYIKIMLYKV